ncbi:hypothetical protein ACFQZO_10295 [Bradyrhizobium sp. GCM10027634]|uniref:hypothetical protein n=1 Tax=unclassified Bradyrhizobium TaxID=2631580 RepID=UPI00263B3B5B|nr:hypothetical protein [Bradyrhizobium sp. WYCCWR 12677]MDN5001273.1 hypothetical protein [Bradyrhizobium sp. WYCCWR 12677]
MKILVLVTGIAAVLMNAPIAVATELPSFELMGFPISAHQVAVMGAANVKEQPTDASLTLAGMPASPHQIAVLTPRTQAIKDLSASAKKPNLISVGLSTR